MDNAYLRRRKGYRAGSRSEKNVAKRLGARLTPASGALAGAKGDCVTDTHLIECKSTRNKSISLKYEWLAKISHEALQQNRIPILTINFTSDSGDTINNGGWVLVRERDYKEMLDGD